MIGEPVHTASKERIMPEVMFSTERMSQISITDLKVKWPLCFTFSFVQSITNEEQ